jgi:hypothetical protein
MEQSDAGFRRPISYGEIRAADFDGLILSGGHAPGMRVYLGSGVLQSAVGDFFAQKKPVGAICHGVLLAARSSSFIEKLSESHCAGPTILCVGIAIGLNRNDPLDERIHRCRGTNIVWLIKISTQAPPGQTSETERNQKRACQNNVLKVECPRRLTRGPPFVRTRNCNFAYPWRGYIGYASFEAGVRSANAAAASETINRWLLKS